MAKIKFSFILKLVVMGGILSIVTAALVMRLLFALSTIYMPDFTGQQVEKAQKTAQSMQIELKVDDEAFSNMYEAGTIITQDIKPRTQIKKGRVVYVVASKGSKLVLVPDITGQQKTAALVTLKNTDLGDGLETVISSNIYKEDTIVSQAPGPGMEVSAGLKVNYLRSAGPGKPNYIMADFSGRDVFESFKAMKKLKLAIDKLEVEQNENLPSGTILSQSPDAGFMINEKTPVSIKATVKESDVKLRKRMVRIVYANPLSVPQLIKINVLSLNGSETVYNEVAEPNGQISVNAAIRGEALVQIFNGTELVKELEFAN